MRILLLLLDLATNYLLLFGMLSGSRSEVHVKKKLKE